MIAKPFLKWAGGKTALLPEILPRLPKQIDCHYEPFLGGGAVFFALAAEKRFKEAVVTDDNGALATAYLAVARHTDELIRKLRGHESRHSKEHYYKVRAQKPDSVVGVGARLIYLNRTCFNGLYRVNKKGEFNVPFGDYANPTICDEENLRAAAAVLRPQTTVVACSDFEAAIEDAKKGDAVYFDPPYAPLSPTSSFASYTKGGFGEKEQVRLRDAAAKLVKKGVHVLLSNSDTPFTRELYDGKEFKIETVEAPRRINSKGGKRGNVSELLISGKN